MIVPGLSFGRGIAAELMAKAIEMVRIPQIIVEIGAGRIRRRLALTRVQLFRVVRFGAMTCV